MGHNYCCPGPELACSDLKEAKQQTLIPPERNLEIIAAKVLISATGRSYSNTVPSLGKFLSLTLAVLYNVVSGEEGGCQGRLKSVWDFRKRVMKLAFLLVIHILAWLNSI